MKKTYTIDDYELTYRWGFQFHWFGWHRCIWFSIGVELHRPMFHVMACGCGVSYGWHLDSLGQSSQQPGSGRYFTRHSVPRRS